MNIENEKDYITNTYTLRLIEGDIKVEIKLKKKQYNEVEEFLERRERYLIKKKKYDPFIGHSYCLVCGRSSQFTKRDKK